MDDYVTKPIQIEQIIQILTNWTSDKFIQHQQPIENTVYIEALDAYILDWKQSLALAANKEDLVQDLLKMLVDSFPTELAEIEQLIELRGLPAIRTCLTSLCGKSVTRYVGTPKLQRITGDFEQFISIRKERRKADEAFIQDVMKRFDEPIGDS
jgi:two-component system sensor histidine kinase BarA